MARQNAGRNASPPPDSIRKSKNGDKCAWIETQNVTLGGHQFAVQPTWSNEAFDAGRDGCAVSR